MAVRASPNTPLARKPTSTTPAARTICELESARESVMSADYSRIQFCRGDMHVSL
jgi:hypothetical protein